MIINKNLVGFETTDTYVIPESTYFATMKNSGTGDAVLTLSNDTTYTLSAGEVFSIGMGNTFSQITITCSSTTVKGVHSF